MRSVSSAWRSVCHTAWSIVTHSPTRLGVRILGEVKKNLRDLLRRADAIFIEELRNTYVDPNAEKPQTWYDATSQAFAVFLPVKSVGVMGDGRTYEYVVALRAVQTQDFMTAHWAHLPHELCCRFLIESLTKCGALIVWCTISRVSLLQRLSGNNSPAFFCVLCEF